MILRVINKKSLINLCLRDRGGTKISTVSGDTVSRWDLYQTTFQTVGRRYLSTGTGSSWEKSKKGKPNAGVEHTTLDEMSGVQYSSRSLTRDHCASRATLKDNIVKNNWCLVR